MWIDVVKSLLFLLTVVHKKQKKTEKANNALQNVTENSIASLTATTKPHSVKFIEIT